MTPQEKHPTIRQSLLSAFDNCPLSAKWEVEYGTLDPVEPHNVSEWSSHPQARGTLTHRVLGKCLNEMALHGEGRIETDVAQAILLEVLRQADVPPEEIEPVPMQHAKDLYWITTKWAHENTWDIANLVSVEERLFADVTYPDPDGGFVTRTLTGQTDAVFGEGDKNQHAIVLDWKDTWGLPGPTDLSFEGYFQQRFYAWLLMRNYPFVQQVTLREFYVRFSEVREATVHRIDLEEIEAELAALVERFDRSVTADVWKPAPGKHCSYCPRPTACPIFPTARSEGRVATDEEAAKVAAQVLVAEAALKQSKASLREWVNTNGAVPVKDAKEPNRVYGFQVTTRTERPTKEKLEEAIARGATPEQISALYKENVGTRFTSFVQKPVIEPDDDIMEKLRDSVAMAEERGA